MRMVGAVVAAGGAGRRLKSRHHKPFVPLAGRPLVSWTLKALEQVPAIGGIVLVVHRQDLGSAKRLLRRFRVSKVLAVVPGGATRSESVSRGLAALPKEFRWVLIHDGARPLVSPSVVEETLRTALRFKAATAAVPVVPTVKEGRGRWVKRTLNRNHLWAVQTPQAFRRDLLEKAHLAGRARRMQATDDAALVETLGVRVRIVPGSHRNIKVTTPEDLVIAEALLKNP